MDLNIIAGKRVLYKQGSSNWMVGTIKNGNAEVNGQGLWIPIIPKNIEDDEIHYAEINQIYTDAKELEPWMEDALLTKEEYIKVIHGEDFHRSVEMAWVSDGEYYYYPVTKFADGWINKQPFEYILRRE